MTKNDELQFQLANAQQVALLKGALCDRLREEVARLQEEVAQLRPKAQVCDEVLRHWKEHPHEVGAWLASLLLKQEPVVTGPAAASKDAVPDDFWDDDATPDCMDGKHQPHCRKYSPGPNGQDRGEP